MFILVFLLQNADGMERIHSWSQTRPSPVITWLWKIFYLFILKTYTQRNVASGNNPNVHAKLIRAVFFSLCGFVVL